MIAVQHSIIEKIRRYFKTQENLNDLYKDEERIQKEIEEKQKILEENKLSISRSNEFKDFVALSSKDIKQASDFYFEVDGSMVNLWFSGIQDNRIALYKEPLYKSGLEIGADKMKKIPTSS